MVSDGVRKQLQCPHGAQSHILSICRSKGRHGSTSAHLPVSCSLDLIDIFSQNWYVVSYLCQLFHGNVMVASQSIVGPFLDTSVEDVTLASSSSLKQAWSNCDVIITIGWLVTRLAMNIRKRISLLTVGVLVWSSLYNSTHHHQDRLVTKTHADEYEWAQPAPYASWVS